MFELDLWERCGEITNLEREVHFQDQRRIPLFNNESSSEPRKFSIPNPRIVRNSPLKERELD